MRIANLSFSLASGLVLAGFVHAQEKISGPFTHENLSVFLIHGQNGANRYVALKEAMEQKKVVVHETQQVNELAVENLSDQPVFIQGGDIVKGGQQDRVITNDFVLPPKSGRLPLAAFCVEQGRWTQRGVESVKTFGGSTALAGVALDPRSSWDQMSVWNGVIKLQEALARKLAQPELVRAKVSPSSLPLTLASKPVEDAVGGYLKSLAGAGDGKSDVVGAVFAVNGAVKIADVYASADLFRSMWPKLLKAATVEAVGLRESGPVAAVQAPAVTVFLHDAGRGSESIVEVNRRVKLVKRESASQFTVESREGANWVHRSVVKK